MNLVENAIKYSPGGGRVEVRVTDDDDRLRIDVSDEGLGIPPSEQARIFEKFYRADGWLALRSVERRRRLDLQRHAAATRLCVGARARLGGGDGRVARSHLNERTERVRGGPSGRPAAYRSSAPSSRSAHSGQ